jgi:hypothetical protein
MNNNIVMEWFFKIRFLYTIHRLNYRFKYTINLKYIIRIIVVLKIFEEF